MTQFEALTAAAYAELARREVSVAVIEAGLGGRYDATNVIPSKVQVLTSVGLEHTRWLGPTIDDIAQEKLDVVQPGGDARARRRAASRRARAGASRSRPIAARGSCRRAPTRGSNSQRSARFSDATSRWREAAAEAYLGSLDAGAVRAAAAEVLVPGRLQIVGERPLTLLDGAHNPDGMAALAESLPAITAAHDPVIGVISVLDDKDAAGMLAKLLPDVRCAVFTSSQNPRALPPPTLQSLSRQLHGPPSEIVRDPRAAVARARELAGEDGIVIATGSIYLVADLLAPAGSRRVSML